MAIKTSRLVTEFDLRYNGLKSNHETEVDRIDVIQILNMSLRSVYEELVKQAETDTFFRNSLQPLEVKEYECEVLKKTENYIISKIPEDSYKILRRRVLAYKEGCGEKEFPGVMSRTDSLDVLLKHAHWKPSFAWEICLADEGKEGLYFWHNNDYKILKTIIDYYERPEELHAPSLFEDKEYIDWNGIRRTKDVDLKLDGTYIFDQIVTRSLIIADQIKGNSRDIQLNLLK